MVQRIPKSVWIVTLLSAIMLGIWPGVWLGQGDWIWGGVLTGWLFFPQGLVQFIAGQFYTGNPIAPWLATLGYPLALLGYSLCAYWVTHKTNSMRNGLTITVVAAFVSTMASIPVTIISLSIIQHSNIFSFFASYIQGALSMHGFILAHLLISAILGWLIGSGISKLQLIKTAPHTA